MSVSAEVRDTFELYGLGSDHEVVGLTEAAFLQLEQAVRARLVREQVRWGRGDVPTVRSAPTQLRSVVHAQGDGHRFAWWAPLMTDRAVQVQVQVAAGRTASGR